MSPTSSPNARIGTKFDSSSVILFLLAVTVALVAVIQLNLTHLGFASHTSDGALYSRILWGIAHGDWQNPIRNQHAFAEHSSFIFLALAPFARLFGAYNTMFVVQSITLVILYLVLARAIRRHIDGGYVGVLVGLALFVNPFLLNGAVYGVRPLIWALPWVLLAAERFFLDSRVDRWTWISVSIALLCREECGVLFAGMGGLTLVLAMLPSQKKARELVKPAMAMLVVGSLWFGLYYLLLKPAFGSDWASVGLHYSAVASTPVDSWFDWLFTAERVKYTAWVVVSSGLLLLFSPRCLLLAGIIVAGNILSPVFGADVRNHYSALLTPFLFVGVIAVLHRLQSRKVALYAAVACLLAGAIASYVTQATLPGGSNYHPALLSGMPWQDSANQIVENVGPESSVIAPPFLVEHLAERAEVARLPQNGVDTSWNCVIVDRIPISTRTLSAEEYQELRRLQYVGYINQGYEVALIAAPFVVLQAPEVDDCLRH